MLASELIGKLLSEMIKSSDYEVLIYTPYDSDNAVHSVVSVWEDDHAIHIEVEPE